MTTEKEIMTTETAAKFKVGTTYTTGEHRDYVWRFKVLSRTAKFITIEGDTCGRGETVRVGVKPGWDGHEFALPLGKYSMAPTISADMEFTNGMVDA